MWLTSRNGCIGLQLKIVGLSFKQMQYNVLQRWYLILGRLSKFNTSHFNVWMSLAQSATLVLMVGMLGCAILGINIENIVISIDSCVIPNDSCQVFFSVIDMHVSNSFYLGIW